MDIWSRKKRSEVMSKIRSKNTKPEMTLRLALHKNGFRYRLHRKDLPGNPDIVFPKLKVAIFVHGCFWHFHENCREGRIPNTNSKFWENKLIKNIARDEKNINALKKDGWFTIVVWECEIEKNLTLVVNQIKHRIEIQVSQQ